MGNTSASAFGISSRALRFFGFQALPGGLRGQKCPFVNPQKSMPGKLSGQPGVKIIAVHDLDHGAFTWRPDFNSPWDLD